MTTLPSLLLRLLIVSACVLLAAALYVDSLITSTFDDKRYELPAEVFARPLELFIGARVTPAQLRAELDGLGYGRTQGNVRIGTYEVGSDSVRFHSRGFPFPDGEEPSRLVKIDFAGERVSAMSSGGGSVDLLRLEPLKVGGIYPAHGEDRLLVRLAEVPETLIGALKAIEDRNFDKHWGFSPTGIARAALGNVRSGRVVAGGSTITQQLVKNYYLTPERTVSRKLIELIMAVLIELHFDKEEILESYLNEVYLGQDGPRAVHGFALGALHYFDTPLEDLGLHQQALLVGMIRGPSLYNPRRNPERALERRNLVLQVMAEQAVINEEQSVVAQAMPLSLRRGQRQNSFPAYLDLVRRHLKQQYAKEDYAKVGLRIFTPFDPLLQQSLQRSSSSILDTLNAEGDLQTASVVTRTANGEVVAIVGGRVPGATGFNRALDARRPAGSLLKPAVYLAALEQPQRFTLATPLDDGPVTYTQADGQSWSPRNFDRESHGSVLLHAALANSYNQATARLGLELGIDEVVEVLHRLGLPEDRPDEVYIPRVPSLFLGSGEYSPLMMARLYQTLAVDGTRTPLRSIRTIVDREGEVLRNNMTEYERSVDAKAVHLLRYALREVVREGTGRGVYRYLPDDMHVAGKTGTTNDGRDSWFAGFSGDLLAVTWVGRDNNAATGLTGSSGALRIWAGFMAESAKRPLQYRMPEGVELHWIDDDSGLLTGEGCDNARLLPFEMGSAPKESTGCNQASRGIRGWFERMFGGRD